MLREGAVHIASTHASPVSAKPAPIRNAGRGDRVRKVQAMMPALLLPVLLPECAAADAEAAACDRACIVGVTDSYLAPLASHDPSAAQLFASMNF